MTSKYMTAKQMALTSHNLSKDSMSATLESGEVFKWSDHFKVWAGPFPYSKEDAKPPRLSMSKLNDRQIWQSHRTTCLRCANYLQSRDREPCDEGRTLLQAAVAQVEREHSAVRP